MFLGKTHTFLHFFELWKFCLPVLPQNWKFILSLLWFELILLETRIHYLLNSVDPRNWITLEIIHFVLISLELIVLELNFLIHFFKLLIHLDDTNEFFEFLLSSCKFLFEENLIMDLFFYSFYRESFWFNCLNYVDLFGLKGLFVH